MTQVKMAFPSSSFGSQLRGSDVVPDSNPTTGLAFRSMLKELDNGLGQRDMDKLKYLCQDMGIARMKFDSIKRGIHLFAELEKLALVSPDDISLIFKLMEAINRFDLTKKLSAWSGKGGALAQFLSKYRLLMLRISESLSRDEREQLRFYLSGSEGPSTHLPVSVMEESKTLLQLFIQMEKYMLIGPENLTLLYDIMKNIGNIAVAKEIQKYQESISSKSQTDTSGKFTNPGHQQSLPGGHQGTQPNTYPGYNMNSPPWGAPSGGFGPTPFHHHQQLQGQSVTQPQLVGHIQLQQQQPSLLTPNQLTQGTGALSTIPKRPSWYYEAFETKGPQYAEYLWEMVSQTNNEELAKRMHNLRLTGAKPGPNSNVNIKTENEGQEGPAKEPEPEARNLPVARATEGEPTRQQTAQEPLQGRNAVDSPRVVPAQTASVVPQTVRGLPPQPTLKLPRYPMNRIPRGLCIIFNAKEFKESRKSFKDSRVSLSDREGTDKDVEKLLNTFGNNLHFKYHVQLDPSTQDYIDYLKQIQGMDHSAYDCFVCVILTHGCRGHVYGVDGNKVAIDDLIGLFRGAYCPSLAGKPKLFFIQACQGTEPQEGVEIQQDKSSTVPNESDTLISLSTVPGYSSNRSVSQGSWYISTLCHIINVGYKELDLLSMLTAVNDKLSEAADKHNTKQIGMPSYTLRKQLFFNEGM